jgi:RNA polymerase sigma factor (TIGR02999 family)
MAHARLRGERSDHTLGTTALVHEAYLRLVDIDRVDWQDRSHFLAVASTAMRRILVDYARRRRTQKRGGAAEAVPLNEQLIPDEKVDTVLDLNDALERLARAHQRPSKALELYYFGGLTLEETGAALGTSAATAMRDLRFAKAWLAQTWGEVPAVE